MGDTQWRTGFARSEAHGLLPDPDPREIRYTVISVDDHLVEPPDMFAGRLPSALQDRAPKVVETEEGHEVWEFDGKIFLQVGLNAVVGKPLEQRSFDPTRFDEMRRGAWDIHARVHDMDLNGVYASVNFPSSLAGFAGQRSSGGVKAVFASAADAVSTTRTARAATARWITVDLLARGDGVN